MKKRKKNMFKTKRQMFGTRKYRPCHYCGKRLTLKTATFDHVKPRSLGGYDRKKNGVLACSRCNSKKGSKTYYDFTKNKLRFQKG